MTHDPRENVIQLTHADAPFVDLEAAARAFRPLAGRVVVQMDPEPETYHKGGLILMPERAAKDYRPDVGTVIATGTGVKLFPGDRVAVRGYDGTWIESPCFGPYIYPGQIRVYGTACEVSGEPFLTLWWDSIPVRLVKNDMNNEEYKATGKNIVLKRDPLQESQGGVLLPTEEQYRSCLATVISVGEDVAEVKVGDRVHYNPTGLLKFLFAHDKDLAVCTEDAINFVILAEAA